MSRYPLVPLSAIVCPVSRPVRVTPGTAYRTFGVKWWGEGAYERETIDGSVTAAQDLFLICENDLVINKIWVRHGSVAIASRAVGGCAASNEFPTFDLDRSRVEPRWIHWLTKTRRFWEKCAALSFGTSGKNRIKPAQFLTVEVPLPPLGEQRRIVARIEEVAGKIEAARGLQHEVDAAGSALLRSLLLRDAAEQPLVSVGDLVSYRSPDVSVQIDATYHFAGVYSFGRGVFRGQRRRGDETSYQALTKLRVGDFVYPKLMAWEGALGIVPSECDGLYVSPEFPVFEVNRALVLPETLDVYFRTPSVWPMLSGESTGTNVRRRRLHPSTFLAHRIPLPSMTTQRLLREVKARLDITQRIREESAAELDALLPAVLERAFSGAL